MEFINNVFTILINLVFIAGVIAMVMERILKVMNLKDNN